MKIPFFTSTKRISLERLHEAPIDPERDWLIIISVFCSVTLVSVIFSTFLFYYLLRDERSTSFVYTENSSIDQEKLGAAVRFIENRKVE